MHLHSNFKTPSLPIYTILARHWYHPAERGCNHEFVINTKGETTSGYEKNKPRKRGEVERELAEKKGRQMTAEKLVNLLSS